MKLTSDEKKAKKVFEHEIKRWRRILLIDPVWTVQTNIVEDDEMGRGDASVDIGTSEYYIANIDITRGLLVLKGNELTTTATGVACHELLHIATADYQRAALVAAADNDQMQEELRYRYEQMVSRLSMILFDLDMCGEELENEPIRRKTFKSTKEMLRVPEVPIGEKNS